MYLGLPVWIIWFTLGPRTRRVPGGSLLKSQRRRGLESLAREAGMSRTAFETKFHAVMERPLSK